MIKRKLLGFSLAELLISLLIISIALSAAIPTLTRKSGASREYIWRWSTENNSAYFGVGSNQSAIIGAETIPLKGSSLETILSDDEVNIGGAKFSNTGDKLLLVKKTVYLGANNTAPSAFANSHISFYNAANSTGATTSDITYAGRIASDKHNLAFGIGSLQSLEDGVTTDAGNTAIGHYTLLRNTKGLQNTAIGEKALSYNTTGTGNTAAGYKALFRAGSNADETSYNTAFGNSALQYLTSGSYNTALGANALNLNTSGKDNLGLGYSSLSSASGSNNVGIGNYSCYNLQSGDNNICIGNRSILFNREGKVQTTDNYSLTIASRSSDDDNSTPLIQGHMKQSNGIDKELIINAKDIEFRPYNSGATLFKVLSYANDSAASLGTGYGTGQNGYTGQFFLSLRKNFTDSTTLSFTGTKDDVVIASYNEDAPIATMKTNGLKNISFNNILNFKFPNASTPAESKNVIGIYTGNSAEGSATTGNNYTLSLNGRITVEDNNDAPILSITKNDGFMLSTGSGGSSMKIKKDSAEISLKDSNTNNFIYTNVKDQFSVSIDSGKFQIRSQNGGNLVADNYYITKDNVTFKALTDKTVKMAGQGTAGSWSLKLTGDLYKDLSSICENLSKAIEFVSSHMTSDARLKDISGDNTAGLKEINALEVKNFTYKNDKEKTPHVGVIAQQLQKVFPNSVFKGDDGYLRIRTEEIFYAMVNSIKELYTQIQDLTSKLTGLDNRITELEKQNAQLKKQNAEFEKRLLKLEKTSK